MKRTALCLAAVCTAVSLCAADFSARTSGLSAAVFAAAEPSVHFAGSTVQAGVPMKAVPEGITGDAVSYRWTVGGKAAGTDSDSYTPTQSDLEQMITVTVSADGAEYACSAYFSTLPVVYIETAEEITSKTEYIAGTLTVQGNAEFSAANVLYSGEMQIRGRGNYTWEHDKKPYKIKLGTKTGLLGMSPSKHWVLLAEYMDPTHLRNEVMPSISETLGMDYTAHSEAVAVVLNGEYNGLYHLGENVRVAKDRVNIYDWEGTAEDIAKAVYKQNKASGMTKDDRDALEDQLTENLEWVTSGSFTWGGKAYTVSDFVTLPEGIDGGYLLELDTYDLYHTEQVSDFETAGEQPIQFKSPEYAVTNPEMYNYAKDYIQAFENAVSADDFYTEYNGLRVHYSDLFDMDSLVQYWLMLELSSNCDGMRYSNYMYKDFGEKFKMGPAWDFDWTWNASYIVPTNEWWTDQNYYNNTAHWYKYLVHDPYFLTRAYELYQAHKAEFAQINADGGMIDSLAEELALPAKADLAKWHEKQDFDEELAKTKEYVTERFQWLEQQFADVKTLAKSLGCDESTLLAVGQIKAADSGVQITAQVQSADAASVVFHVNGILAGEAKVSGGTASLTVPASLLLPTESALNTVQIRMKDASGAYLAAEPEPETPADPWGRGGWNPWEEEPAPDVSSLVYSAFANFTAESLGIRVSVQGDFNADGVFDAKDAVALQKYLLRAGSAANWQAGDFNADRKLTAADLTLMKRALLF